MKTKAMKLGAVTLLTAFAWTTGQANDNAAEPWADAAAETQGWRLGLQCWTFNRLTTFECIDRASAMGLRYIEIFPGQKLSPESDAKVQHNMDAEALSMLRSKLIEAGVQVTNYGVVGLPNKEDACRQVFDFARALGIETINSEPGEDALPLVEKLADEYGINVALHNHPKASRYWNPETAYKAVTGRSKRLGLCADTGHWARSGVDPLAAIQKCGDRILTFHFKDVNESGVRKAHDVPWGTGVCGIKDLLAELKKQGFRGVFSIEYEHRPPTQADEVKQCVDNFHRLAAEVGGTPKFVRLFNGSNLDGWTVSHEALNDTWTVRDGILCNAGKPNGYIRTETDHKNFIWRLQFRRAEKGNSGFLLRMQMPDKVWPKCIEVQGKADNVGDLINMGEFAMQPEASRTRGRRTAKRFATSERALGEWNDLQIELRGGDLRAWVNGVIQNEATQCEVLPGKLGIQSEGGRMELKNIGLVELP